MSTLKEKIEQAKDRIKRRKKVATATVATAAAVVVGAGAPTTEANAQSTGFKLEPIQTPIQQAPQQSNQDGKTISFQQAQRQVNSPEQRLWASLPPHVQNEIITMGYQLNVEYSLKLNNALTPNSANKRYILYSCAVTDIRQPGKIIYLPYYERDPRNSQRAMQPKRLSVQAAVNQQTMENGVYRPEPGRFPTNKFTYQGINGRASVDNKGNWSIYSKRGSVIHNGQNGNNKVVIRQGRRGR